jgi:glutamate carboxypeptidase
MTLSPSEFEPAIPKLISRLRSMVEIESPTYSKDAVDQLGAYIANEARLIGAETESFSQSERGDHLTFRWGAGQPRILLMTHMDTVYPLGTLEEMPWRESKGRLYGPGVLDMKVGIALALSAIETLRDGGSIHDVSDWHKITIWYFVLSLPCPVEH